jgi:hypothetical protein
MTLQITAGEGIVQTLFVNASTPEKALELMVKLKEIATEGKKK